MRLFSPALLLSLCICAVQGQSQQVSAPQPQPATIDGTVVDTDIGAIPNALISVDAGSAASDHHTINTAGDGSFSISGLNPAVSYHVTITAPGFAPWTSPEITLHPGERLDLPRVKLTVSMVETSVAAASPEEIAIEQVKGEEQQRILGIIPNFYVVYDQQFVALTPKLKFRLALRASTDVVNIAGSAVLGGINWAAASSPDYRTQGFPGYAERFGAAYAGSVEDVMIGGAILPSLLHQDPRYFYQGTGSNKSRALHAISAPFVAKGDNGKWQFNYSSVGGDLATGALENIYFPKGDRGPGLVFGGAATTTAGRMVNALFQEFLLPKFTTRAKAKP